MNDFLIQTPKLSAWSTGGGMFRFQTNNSEIAAKLQTSLKFEKVGIGLNCYLRIYAIKSTRGRVAKLVKKLTGENVLKK